jgi:hypothetical protein
MNSGSRRLEQGRVEALILSTARPVPARSAGRQMAGDTMVEDPAAVAGSMAGVDGASPYHERRTLG